MCYNESMTGISPIGPGSGGNFEFDPRQPRPSQPDKKENPADKKKREEIMQKTAEEIARKLQGPPEDGKGKDLDLTSEP